MINNVQSGQLGGSCFLEISLDYDGDIEHLEDATWTALWSRSSQAQATWMTWEATNLSDFLEEEFYLRYRITTSEENDVGWYVDDLVITGVVNNYTWNDLAINEVSIEPLVDEKEEPRKIDVIVQNVGENATNRDGRPGFVVLVTIEDEEGMEVYNESIHVADVLDIGDTHTVSFNTGNGKDWVPEEYGFYEISAQVIWEADGNNIDENPQNDLMLIEGIVQFDFFSDDMENGENEWGTDGHTDGWALGTPTIGPTPHSGTNCWGTNLDGNYPDLNDHSLELEHRIDLRTTSDAKLRFWHWLEIEAHDYDTAYVEAKTTSQSTFSTLWINPSSERAGDPYATDGWEFISLDLDDFAFEEVFIRFRLESDGDTNYQGWYIDDVSILGAPTPSYDAMVYSIDYPTEGEFIPPSETIEIYATVMNVGLNQEVVPVRCWVVRKGSTPVTYDLGEQRTAVLDPGEKAQVSFPWQVPPCGGCRYRIDLWTELDDDGNESNDQQVVNIQAWDVYDISVLALIADPMIQEVAMTRHVVAEVKNIGNTELMGNVRVHFEALFRGETVDEYTAMTSLSRGEIKEVTWEWQSFKYGEYTINVYASIFDETDQNPDDNRAVLEGIRTQKIIFSDTREDEFSPAHLDPHSGQLTVWDWEREGGTFWTGDNETDPDIPSWHIDDVGHFSRASWYGGIPSQYKYGNNMRAQLISEALDLEGSTDVHLSLFTKYVLEGRQYDFVEVSISTDSDDDDSWIPLMRFPEFNQSHDSSLEPDSLFGWVHKDVVIPDEYLTDSFYIRILMRTDNGITYDGVWIDDITIYGNSSGNHAPVTRFSATQDSESYSYSRHVIQNPPLDLHRIEGDFSFNNLPLPVEGEQHGIQLGEEIQYSADMSFDPDPDDIDLSYRWYFGDGFTEYGKEVTYAYTGDLPLEGYFRVTLKVEDDDGLFSEDTMRVWIGNKGPIADYIVTSQFDTSTPINDSNDGVENGLIDVFYGDRITFQQASSDPEHDYLTYDWEFRCDSSKYSTEAIRENVSGIVGDDFLFEGLDGKEPIIPVTILDYTATIFVSDGVSISEMSYTVRVHPFATYKFVTPVKMGYTLLDASVTLTWRGFSDEAAPGPKYISPDRPVFVHIDPTDSPDPNLSNRGGIGLVYNIHSVGCKLQNGSEGFINAEISLPIRTSDLETMADSFALQEDLRLECYDEIEKRFMVVDGSHVLSDGGVKYVVGEVDHFSIYSAIVDSLYNESNPKYITLLPDLSVHTIEFSRSPVLHGQEVGIRATIRNGGETHAYDVTVRFYGGQSYIGSSYIYSVDAGGMTLVNKKFMITMNDPSVPFENHYINVKVNEFRFIDEGSDNYANNQDSERLIVISPDFRPPPPRISSPGDGDTLYGDMRIKGDVPARGTDVNLVYQPFGNNDLAWHVERVDPYPVSVLFINYTLVDQHGDDVPGGHGRITDIYGLNFDDPTSFSFQDNDRDGKISAGDVFLVKNLLNGGLAKGGYSLELEFAIVGHVEISINEGNWTTVSGIDSWNHRWDTTSVEDGEYTVKARSSNGHDTSEEVSIRVVVDQSSEEPELLVIALLISLLGVLSLILLCVVFATFDIEL